MTLEASVIRFGMTKDDWERQIDGEPTNTLLRLAYADWLEELDDELSTVQRWLVKHNKTPGPCCVMKAAWHEASWFNKPLSGTKWSVPTHDDKYAKTIIIASEWCLPKEIFCELMPVTRRHSNPKVYHYNRFAKSWDGRREAEAALINLLD